MKYMVIIPLLLAMCSCNNAGKAGNNNARLEQLANRTCRAKALSAHRYALADSIRFAQDTLSHAKTKADSSRLQSRLKIYLENKPKVIKASLALADTIRMQMDSLIPYGDKAAERRFTASFDSIMTKKGCK
jgi:hypothetical protein